MNPSTYVNKDTNVNNLDKFHITDNSTKTWRISAKMIAKLRMARREIVLMEKMPLY